jgi:hypothetical protein
METLKNEADGKAAALKAQLDLAHGDAKAKLEARVSQVKSAYHTRGVKLAQAWGLTKEALAV